MPPLSPEPMPSSSGNSVESVEQPWLEAEAYGLNLDLLRVIERLNRLSNQRSISPP
jgi:hypothetical protein